MDDLAEFLGILVIKYKRLIELQSQMDWVRNQSSGALAPSLTIQALKRILTTP